MTVQIYRQYVFTDGTKYSPNDLDTEFDQIASTINNANAALLTWDNVKAVLATLTTATITTANITTANITNASLTNPLPIGSGGTNSSTALNNNRMIKSSAGKIIEAAALTSGQICVSDSNGIPVTGVTGNMNSTKITSLANGTSASDAAAFGQIKVLQIVYGTSSTQFSTTSNTFQATNLTATITPTSSSNRILIIASGRVELVTTNHVAFLTIARGTTNLGGTGGFQQLSSVCGSTLSINVPTTLTVIDSPATTSATSYTVYIRNDDNATTVDYLTSNQTGTIILAEIV